MTEIIVFLEDIDPIVFFGTNNSPLDKIRSFFPKIKILARGNEIKCDTTQIDLPRKSDSGLLQAMRILTDIPGILIIKFDERDIVRHELVKRIVRAYEKEENNTEKKKTVN